MKLVAARAVIVALVVGSACGAQTTPPSPPIAPAAPPPDAAVTVVPLDIDSDDILARPSEAPQALVKHVLIAWNELAPIYQGRLDPRAAKRTQRDAAALVLEIAEQLRRDPTQIDALIERHSEDPGSLSFEPYSVSPGDPYVKPFKDLSLRLAIDEVGVVRTRFGYHAIVRVAPPPPDPLQSNDILARAAGPLPVDIAYVKIGWKGASTSDTVTRSKAEADALAVQLLDRARAGADPAALAQTHSDENPSPKPLTVSADDGVPDVIRDLAARLQIGEAGMVVSKVGWLVIKRVPPPPPDPLESVAILGRTTVAERVMVKHILLGWKDLHVEDERGAKRARKELEKLVKATVARLKKGAKIEPLMAQLSEDPGSAQSGQAYEATPDGPLVEPFKQLALRLKLNEVGVVKTPFGIHIIQRTE